jgi:hypothetical protein
LMAIRTRSIHDCRRGPVRHRILPAGSFPDGSPMLASMCSSVRRDDARSATRAQP